MTAIATSTTAFLLLLSGTISVDVDPGDPTVLTQLGGSDVDVTAKARAQGGSASDQRESTTAPATTEYRRLGTEWCDALDDPVVHAACTAALTVNLTVTGCARTTLLFVRHRTLDDDGHPGPWSAFELAANQPACQVTIADLETAVSHQLATLQIAASPLHVQPDTDEVLLNVPVITSTTADPQTLTTTLLGTAVEIEVTPVRFTWDFHDGAPLTTTTPGRPYPDPDITHTYTRPGPTSITLTTTWSARFRVAGQATWHDATGTATTTSPAHALTAVAKTTHLVEDPVDH